MKSHILVFLTLTIFISLPISGYGQHKNIIKAKPFALYDLHNNLIKYSDYEGEKILILSFFATWCEPCLKEIKELEEFNKKLEQTRRASQIEILLVSTDKGRGSKKKVRQFVNKHQIKFKVVHDLYGVMSKGWKVKGLPTLFLIT
ncbi:MAG: TlpA family protein disulfide reductase, partial [Elusimicrobia bacterium]|nr:TlpA family protein disulfide reductase [Elusimicrobiota bacterium]